MHVSCATMIDSNATNVFIFGHCSCDITTHHVHFCKNVLSLRSNKLVSRLFISTDAAPALLRHDLPCILFPIST